MTLHHHHCHLYHDQHWFPLFPIKNSLESGVKNDTAKCSNLVARPNVHVTEIRWLNLTFIICLKHGVFSAEMKQFLTYKNELT